MEKSDRPPSPIDDRQPFSPFPAMPPSDVPPRAKKNSMAPEECITSVEVEAANTPEQIGKVLERAFFSRPRGNRQIIGYAPILDIVTKSIGFVDHDDAQRMVEPLIALQHDLPDVMLQSTRLCIEMGLGHALLGNTVGGRTKNDMWTWCTPERALKAIELFDSAEILTNAFWIDFGVHAKATTRVPESLPLFYRKIAGPDHQIADRVTSHELIGETYMADVLAHYSTDNKRSAPAVDQLLASIKPFASLDATAVPPEAEYATQRYMHPRKSSGTLASIKMLSEGKTSFADDREPTRHIGSAFLRVLSTLQPHLLDCAVQDVQHASIVARIFNPHATLPEMDVIDFYMRFPELEIGDDNSLLKSRQESLRQRLNKAGLDSSSAE